VHLSLDRASSVTVILTAWPVTGALADGEGGLERVPDPGVPIVDARCRRVGQIRPAARRRRVATGYAAETHV